MHHAGYVAKRTVHHLSVLIAVLKGAVCKTRRLLIEEPQRPAADLLPNLAIRKNQGGACSAGFSVGDARPSRAGLNRQGSPPNVAHS